MFCRIIWQHYPNDNFKIEKNLFLEHALSCNHILPIVINVHSSEECMCAGSV